MDNVHKKTAKAGVIALYCVYILKCLDGYICVGSTNNIRERVLRHNKGYDVYTRTRIPVKLLFYCCFPNKYLAYKFEKYLKTGSGRVFMKKHLIRG